MIAAILGVITGIGTMLSSSYKKHQERKIAEHEVLIAKENARKELAMQTVKAELELGQLQIKATNRGFKYFTFLMWFGPFMISTVLPEYGIQVFKNLNQLPEWYVQSCMVIMFAIWGIQAGKDSINHIFAGLGSFFKQRQKLNFNRKLFYDVVRSTQGGISQHEVDIYEKALNAAAKLEDK